MQGKQLSKLEAELCRAADQLRANSKLTASEYSMHLLGLIFLRHAYNRFQKVKIEVEKTLPTHLQRGKRTLTKKDFEEQNSMFLTDKTQFDYLVLLPEGSAITVYGTELKRNNSKLAKMKFKSHLKNMAIGSSQKVFTISSLKDIMILNPLNEIQLSFNKIIIPLINSIENLQNQNRLLKEARVILLPRLMSRIIDVEELQIETLQTAN